MENACSKLEQTLKSGRLAITVEIGPPKHSSPEGIVATARLLKDYVDAANITDCQSRGGKDVQSGGQFAYSA